MSDGDAISSRTLRPPPPPPRVESPASPAAPASTQQQQQPARPAARANVPGSSDSFESNTEMQKRAGQAKVLGQGQPQVHAPAAVTPAERSLHDVTEGIVSRNDRLSRANRTVQQHETTLAQQLEHLGPTMKDGAERQKYADTHRQKNASAYTEATSAARDLADYTQKNMPAIKQGVEEMEKKRGISGPTHSEARLVGALATSQQHLETAVNQSPTGDKELQGKLQKLGEDYGDLAKRASKGNPEPEDSSNPSSRATKPLVKGIGATFNKLAQSATSLAKRASGAFGAVGSAIGVAENSERITAGTARADHYTGAALQAGTLASGAARLAGITVGGPITGGLAAASVANSAVTAFRDRKEFQQGMSDTLRASGVDPAAAAGLGTSSPGALKSLAGAGYTPDQIRGMAASAPVTMQQHPQQIEGVIAATKQFGLTPAQTVDLAKKLGPENADIAFNGLAAARAGNPGAPNAAILADLRGGFYASEASRRLADLLGAR